MRVVHTIRFRIFCDEFEAEAANDSLVELLHLYNEKTVKLTRTSAEGFNKRKIIILEAVMDKTRVINAFLKKLITLLQEEDKEQIIIQAESGVGDDLNFFMRFDKKRWIEKKELVLTQEGDCIHLTMNLAAYPKKKEKGIELVKEIFKRSE